MNNKVRILILTQVLSSASEWMWFTVAMVATYQIAGTGGAGATAIAASVPPLLASPWVSAWADRHGPRLVLLRALSVRSGALATAAVVSLYVPTFWLYLIVIAIEGMTAFAVGPALRGLLTWLVSTPADLVKGNLRLSSAENLGTLAGPVLGGLLLEVTSIPVTLVAAFGVSALAFIVSLGLPESTGEQTASGEGDGALRTLVQGAGILWKDEAVRWVLLGIGLVSLLQGVVEVAVVPLALDTLGLGNWGPGAFTAAMGVGGMVAGIALSAVVGRSWLSRAFCITAVGQGVATALAGLTSVIWAAFMSVALFGAALSTAIGLGTTMVSRFAPLALLARALGLVEVLTYVGVAAGNGATPLLAGALGVPGSLLLVGAVAALATLALWPALSRLDRSRVSDPDVAAAFSRVSFLAALPVATGERMEREALVEEVEAGAIVFRQGEFGSRFYIVVRGLVQVEVDGRAIRTLEPGAYFGEMALLRRIPRTATIRAVAPTRLVVVEQRAFLSAVTGRTVLPSAESLVMPTDHGKDLAPLMPGATSDLHAQADALKSVPLLRGLPHAGRLILMQQAQVLAPEVDTELTREGSRADAYYVILAGNVTFLVAGEVMGSLGPGEGFGELALLHQLPRTATAVTAKPAVLLRFPAEAFLRAFALGPETAVT